YSLESGYTNLVVTLDGATVSSSGTLTVSGNRSLSATAEPETGFDIRGKWAGFLYWAQGHPPVAIIDCFLTVTFEGGLESGIATGYMDCASGFSPGTYTVEGNQVKFYLEFYNGSGVLHFGGTIENDNRMRGWHETSNDVEWRREGWMLERQ
ncbi:MAG: hypothetical protein KAS65_12975, partial [Candidatus Aminicenantes bacterium]|nr:hypothetical protein [Candidatus Aminicenantes bacterium]